MSVLDDREVLFPMVEVETHCLEWITLKNPSSQPVVMQLILNSGEIVDECKEHDEFLQPSSSSTLRHITLTKYGFSMGKHAVTEAYVHPNSKAVLGPIIFHPSGRCSWRSSALIRNNLSGVEWLPLRGFGGLRSLALFEGSAPLQPSFLNLSPPDLFYVENSSSACSQPLSKEFYAKNVGDLPLEVSRIEVSGTECKLDGFVVHDCKGFVLEPGESTKLKISYQADFSAAMVQRDLELALPTGILVIPMKASIPISMLTICRKSVLWNRVKKSSVSILLMGFIMYLVFYYIFPQAIITFDSQHYFLAHGKSPLSISRLVGGKSSTHLSPKSSSKFALFAKMNGFLRSIEEEEILIPERVTKDYSTHVVNSSKSIWSSEKKLTSSSLPKTVESCDVQDPLSLPPASLTVKIGKEKGRRRRKKKGSGPGGLTSQLEVSSSQSGNSTPSSPLSPNNTSLTPTRFLPLSPNVDQKNPFTQVANKHTEKNSASKALERKVVSMKYVEKPHFEPKNTISKPHTLPSTAFSCAVKPSPSILMPTIAPHERAPGSKLFDRSSVSKSGESGQKDDVRYYDIWGEHLFGLHQSGKSNEVFAKSPLAIQHNSDSFFVRGPPSLKSVSPHQEDV